MAEPASIELLPQTALGQYEIRGRLGSGGMGDVYDAVHKMLDKRVALKTLRRRFLDDQTIVARFLREGQLASRMRHPNIVDVTDVGMIGGLPCLVMEHLDGEPFSAMIKRDGALPVAQVVDILLPILAALEFAHERGVLHRDLKPSNIFLARSWNGEIVPKVLDFGISKLVSEEAQDQQVLTTDSAFIGTPLYAPPEMMRAQKNVDGRADQYSIGVILYEASTGVRPFVQEQGDFVGLAMAICNGQYTPPRQVKADLPEAFERIVVRAMSKDPEERFPSMSALGEALLPFASERARVIWTPVFRGSVDRPPTQVVDHTAAIASRPFAGATPPPQAPSGGFWSAPATPAPSVGGAQSAPTPSFGGMTGPPMPGVNSQTPPPYADRTPSYAQGGTVPSARAPQSGGGGAWIAVAALVALMVVVGVVALKKRSARAAEESTTAAAGPATAAAEHASYRAYVAVTPDTAAVSVDGKPAGTGRLDMTFAAASGSHVLDVSAPGHEPVKLEFDASRPLPSNLQLKPTPHAHGGAAAAGQPAHGGARPAGGGAAPAGGAGAAATGKGKGSDGRPKTDNIDPWE